MTTTTTDHLHVLRTTAADALRDAGYAMTSERVRSYAPRSLPSTTAHAKQRLEEHLDIAHPDRVDALKKALVAVSALADAIDSEGKPR